MGASQEIIDAVIARVEGGERMREAMLAEGVSKEDRQEVRTTVMQITFRSKLENVPLRMLERREAMMINRLQVISEVIAEKMGTSSTS